MAPSLARTDLEALLRARKLDGTLAPAPAPASPSLDRWEIAIPTGFSDLDHRLAGGFPRGHASEIIGPASSGRTSVLTALMAAAVRHGELAALVDTLDGFDPESAAGAGLDLARLLWVRGVAAGGEALAAAIDRALKATNLLLQSGDFGVVALDLADVPPRAIQRIPFTTWLRLQRAGEGSRTVTVVMAGEHVSRSAGGLTLALGPSRSLWSGALAHARVFRGLDLAGRVIRARLGPDDAVRLKTRR
jgi:hypothetical protein